MNIRVDLNTNIADGSEVVFRSPADCSQVTGLVIYHNGGKTEFAFADAHGNNVGDIDHLFAENAVVKVILDVTASMAFVQNADTNAYIERTFVKSVNGQAPDEKGNVEVKTPEGGNGTPGQDGEDGGFYVPEVVQVSETEAEISFTSRGGENMPKVEPVTLTLPRGADGKKGDKGDKGDQGEQGPQGEPGAKGEQGVPGIPGNDGAPGADGKDGYTPVKYIDYYTPTDKAEFEAFIASELAKRGQLKPDFAQSTDDCTDTSKLYVLPDGFIYGFVSVTETVKDYTNLAKTFESGRYNSSGVVTAQSGATACTDYIGPLENGDIIRIKGFGAGTDYNSHWANANKANSSSAKLGATAANYSYSYDSATGTITLQKITTNSGYIYFRISGILTGTTDDVIITLNEEIKDKVVTTQKWVNTGHAFVPADYEARILALEDDMNDAKANIIDLKNKVETPGGGSSGAVAIPSYWEKMVAEKTETVKALQTAGGKNCVSFAWASDTHIPDNDGGRTTDIGKVIAKMLDNCEIPFAVLSGDINTRASCSTEDKLVNAQVQMPVHLAPLWGTDRLLMALGNHDGCWGDSSGHYRHQFSPERMWQVFFRGQALDFRRVFSDDGLYFYVDNVAQRTRIIVLNSHYAGEYAEDANGFAVNNRFATSCYGQAQLDWLANEALDMPDGYSAILTTHAPPNVTYTVDKAQFIGIINAYCNKTTFSGSYTEGVNGWSNSTVNVDFSNAKGEIIAVFTGHVHGDSIDTETMTCPILTILSAGASANEAYKDGAPTRTPGTDTETSFDVVTVNKATRTIHCTRVGAGSDREINY